ncbi:hypothetical protein BN946_scf185000.g5 [Trametes cinnabarina]|uniref:Bacteriophage T5 Orf172 DNA-binding domain-containing protein n=1 Tax=Pycnoporus cinnabarinus TaxID=5643 RepID=A0A060S394_PYCCI|nr:hypothetical protein BN946_scf185000.g5 [Trametes cinnabarina]
MSRIRNFFNLKGRESDSPQAAADSRSKMHYMNINASHSRGSTSTDASGLVDDLARLSLGSRQQRRQEVPRQRPPANDDFTGGFVLPEHSGQNAQAWGTTTVANPPISPRGWQTPPPPRHLANGTPPVPFPEPQMDHIPPPGPLPAPPIMPLAMPAPQFMSRTMQYATSGDLPQHANPLASLPRQEYLRPPLRPKSHGRTLTRLSSILPTAPNSAPAKSVSAGPSRPALSSFQTPPRRKRSASTPPSPISLSSSSSSKKDVRKVQCCATTKQDKQCTRMVPVTTPLSLLSGEDEPHYCRQHIKNAFIDVKFRSRKDPSIEVMYSDWIPDYLQESTKTALRDKMQAKASPADEPGYIYAYEIDDASNPDVVHIKVGRAVKLTKRLAEWDKQCQSKLTHLLGFWPMSRDAEQNGMMRGRVQVGDPGPYCHRVERLVHLELADLALNAPYLDPDFPNVKGDGGNTPRRLNSKGPCPDCGTVHKEIFTFPRATGRYKGREWQDIVRPVIEKWGGFVEAYV